MRKERKVFRLRQRIKKPVESEDDGNINCN